MHLLFAEPRTRRLCSPSPRRWFKPPPDFVFKFLLNGSAIATLCGRIIVNDSIISFVLVRNKNNH